MIVTSIKIQGGFGSQGHATISRQPDGWAKVEMASCSDLIVLPTMNDDEVFSVARLIAKEIFGVRKGGDANASNSEINEIFDVLRRVCD